MAVLKIQSDGIMVGDSMEDESAPRGCLYCLNWTIKFIILYPNSHHLKGLVSSKGIKGWRYSMVRHRKRIKWNQHRAWSESVGILPGMLMEGEQRVQSV